MVRRVLGALATATVSGALMAPAALASPSGSLADWRTGQWWVDRTGLVGWQGAPEKGVAWLVGALVAIVVLGGGGWILTGARTRNRQELSGVHTNDTPAPAPWRREAVVIAGGPLVGSGQQGEDRS